MKNLMKVLLFANGMSAGCLIVVSMLTGWNTLSFVGLAFAAIGTISAFIAPDERPGV